jgi:hypothetical protein
MKKILLVIIVIFTMVGVQNLYAQKKYKLSTGAKTMEIVGEFTCNDNILGKCYASIQKDKVVLWTSEEDFNYVVETSVKFSDIDANDKDAVVVEPDLLDENAFVVNFYCKDGKSCERIRYEQDEKKINSKKIGLLSIKFNTKAEAEAFMAKAKKAMKR